MKSLKTPRSLWARSLAVGSSSFSRFLHTETDTVQRAGHDIVFEGAFRERLAAMGAGVADGIAGPVNVEERNPLVSGLDQLGLAGL